MKDTATLVAILALLMSGLGAFLTFKVGTQANAANLKKVDLEAHRDAVDRLQRIIDEQDRQIERTRMQAQGTADQLLKEQEANFSLREQIRRCQDQIDDLARSRARLEEALNIARPRPGGTAWPPGIPADPPEPPR